MNSLFSEKWKIITSFLIFFLFFLIILFINIKTPLFADDWAFHVAYGEKKVQTFSDAFYSIDYFYTKVNGRSVANFIVVFFATIRKGFFDFFNALFFVLLGVAIYYFANDDKKIRPPIFLGIFFLLWFYLPVPSQTLFWQCGATVYLWMTVFCLIFLIPYKDLLQKNSDLFAKNRYLGVVGMFILGILAGNSHELIAPIIFLITVLTIFFLRKSEKKFPFWGYFASIGVFMGLVIQFIAPGNFIKFRNDNATSALNFSSLVVKRASQILGNMHDHQFLLWIMVGFIFCIYLLNKLYFKNEKCIIDKLMLFLLVFSILLNIMGLAFPYFPHRTFFFSSIFLIIFISRFLAQESFVKIKYLLIFLCIPFFAKSIGNTLTQADQLFENYQKREISISEQKAEGKQDILVEKIKKVKNDKLINDVLNSRESDIWASRFYGVDSIKILK